MSDGGWDEVGQLSAFERGIQVFHTIHFWPTLTTPKED